MKPIVERVGLWTNVLDSLPLSGAQEIVAELDEQGWGSLWFGEAYGREALTAAYAYLSASRRMAVGTGIANIYARDAFATAAAARTLHAAHPGRFVLGLGVSHVPLVERMRGHEYGRPVAAMSAYLDGLDAAAAIVPGEAESPPRVLAALGPRMIELSRDRAQGAHPYLVVPEHTAKTREILGEGPLLVVEQAVVVDPRAENDVDLWRTYAHGHLEIYTGLPNYRSSWLRQGFDESDFVRGGSERLKEAMVARGLDATVRRIREHLDAGASTVLLQVLGEDFTTVPRADWARLAQAVL
ncbi:TIGR03620 family F420-dependent LLM class oxidoreductase [Thermomonospora umbrina]|uniref:Putative F420-dependent oxidoreductase n=1 Tax=Thermomonospora umbrina TaxID=111806 RepID=A0A3D9SWH2_9ACTN|nr:TIGR03620 family F420-dependent LLM class oxidoreductase [Thermomonospora umbrina]REE97345.1 putative F420-dependent oxidoreductase [Thermomonospora umbrina]